MADWLASKNWAKPEFDQAVEALEELQERMAVAAENSFGSPEIKERCGRIELVLRAALWMARTSLSESEASHYLESKLNIALAHYGLQVIHIPKQLPTQGKGME